MGSRARPVPAIIFQGTADIVVSPSTAYRIAGQWATVDRIDTVPDTVVSGRVPGGRTFTRIIHRSPGGQSMIDQNMIDGAGHQYPGGCACSLYGDPAGPDASNLSWDFFLAHAKP
jgi:poly(3-hydroxybutyrate) depolymerase